MTPPSLSRPLVGNAVQLSFFERGLSLCAPISPRLAREHLKSPSLLGLQSRDRPGRRVQEQGLWSPPTWIGGVELTAAADVTLASTCRPHYVAERRRS